MYEFTNRYGDAVEVDAEVQRQRAEEMTVTDVAFLPVLIKAANEATRRDLCSVYDDVATSIGAPTRAELAEAGLVKSRWLVEATREVQVTFTVTQRISEIVTAFAGDAQDEAVGIFPETIMGSDIREAINRYADYEYEVEDETVTHVITPYN